MSNLSDLKIQRIDANAFAVSCASDRGPLSVRLQRPDNVDKEGYEAAILDVRHCLLTLEALEEGEV